MGIREEAIRLHESGFNCAQSVLCACGKYTGLDDDTALALSAGFGGGVRCGEICGAISGAVMAIGMAYPFADASDTKAKERIAALTRECTGRFENEYGCVRCCELKASGYSCAALIEYAAALAEDIINVNKK